MLMTLSHQCDKHSIWLLWLVGYVVGKGVKNTAFVEEPFFLPKETVSNKLCAKNRVLCG